MKYITHITGVYSGSSASADEIVASSNTPITQPTTSVNLGADQTEAAASQPSGGTETPSDTVGTTTLAVKLHQSVMAAYRDANEPLAVLAQRFNISAATIVVCWGKPVFRLTASSQLAESLARGRGHNSKAGQHACSKKAEVTVPSLDDREKK